MMFIPGFLISLLAFPGVILHELAHKHFCDRYGVPVFEVCYFKLGNPAGYVVHDEPRSYRESFAISVAPFLVNTLAALAVFGVVVTFWANPDATGIATEQLGVSGWLLVWIGVSAAMHAFPSTGDAESIWARTQRDWRASPFVLLGLPVVGLIYVANLLSFLWFDVIYAIALLFAVLQSVAMVAV